MFNKVSLSLIFLLSFLTPLFSSPLPINVEGENVSFHENKMVAEGNVRINYKDLFIHSDKASFDISKKIVVAKGNVSLKEGKNYLECDELIYDLKNKKGYIKGIKRGISPPWFWKGEKIEKFSEKKIILRKGEFTTCDRIPPHYHFSAKKVVIYPDDKIKSYNVMMYLGKLPVFYFPYYEAPIKKRPYGWVHWISNSPRRGFSILSHYNWYKNPSLSGKFFIDFEKYKGFGEGGKIRWKREKEKGYFYAYNFNEKGKYYKKYEENRKNARRGKDKLKRWKIYSKYIKEWNKNTFAAKFEKLSDPNFNQDFYFEEGIRGWDSYPLRRDAENYFFLEKNTSSFTYGIKGNFNANYFDRKLEEKPTFYFSIPSYYFSNFLYSFSMETSYLSKIGEKDSIRMLSEQKISFPYNKNSWEIKPSLTLRSDFYGKDRKKDEEWRNSVSEELKISKRFQGLIGKSYISTIPYILFLEQNHPYQNQDNLPYFDKRDRIKGKRSLRIGIDEMWEGERKNLDLLYYVEGIKNGDTFMNGEIKWKINPHISLSNYGRWGLNRKGKNFSSSELSIKKENFRITLGHDLYDDENLNIGRVHLKHKISDLWNFNIYERYNIRYSFLEESKIEMERTLHCWKVKFIIKTEKSRGKKPDVQFLIAFRIKGL